MASAVISNHNESSWTHMGKIPYHLNGNPNPKKKPKHHKSVANGVAGHYREPPAVAPTASDDAYSFNQASTSADASNYGRYLTYNISVYTKPEVLELRKRLLTELEQIKDFQNRIDSGHFSNVANPRSLLKSKRHSVKERPVAAFGSIQERQSFGNVDVGPLLKECSQVLTKLLRNKCAYVFKAPVDVVGLKLHDYHQIVRQPMDLGTVKVNLAKNMYPTPREFAADVRLTFNNALLYNPKLDPVHKFAAEMLARFEELYSPIQQKVDSCLKQQIREVENQDAQFQGNEVLQGNSWSNHNQSLASPFGREKVKKYKQNLVQAPQVSKMVERRQIPVQAHSSASTSSNPPPTVLNHQPKEEPISSPVRAPLQDQKAGIVKQPKPKAKDPNKREMCMEEKQNLGIGLQSLPQEKMPQLVQIIRKRNDHLAADGDEIELDIEALDMETLWELDRFVTNWKKMASKSKRQAVKMNNDLPDVIEAPLSPMADVDPDHLSDNNDESQQKLKDNDEEDVDIDIDDDMPETSFPPVMIEKDEGAGTVFDNGQDQNHDNRGNASSSSSGSGSSSSDSSSSSGSSSGSDSDADEVES